MDANLTLGDRLQRDNTRSDGIVSPGKLKKYYGPESYQSNDTGGAFGSLSSSLMQPGSHELAPGQGIPGYPSPYQPPTPQYSSGQSQQLSPQQVPGQPPQQPTPQPSYGT